MPCVANIHVFVGPASLSSGANEALYTATVSRVADGVGLNLDHSSSTGLSLKCANSRAACLAQLVAGTPPRTHP